MTSVMIGVRLLSLDCMHFGINTMYDAPRAYFFIFYIVELMSLHSETYVPGIGRIFGLYKCLCILVPVNHVLLIRSIFGVKFFQLCTGRFGILSHCIMVLEHFGAFGSLFVQIAASFFELFGFQSQCALFWLANKFFCMANGTFCWWTVPLLASVPLYCGCTLGYWNL